MSAISAETVKKLRDMTSLPLMDCKTALTEAAGDMEKAITILRERNAKIGIKRGEREAGEGRIAAYVDEAQGVGAIIELRCESPMVVRAEQFITLGNDLARHVAQHNPTSLDQLMSQQYGAGKTVKDRVEEAIGLIRENMKVARFARLTGILGEYCHHDGSVGVLLQATGTKADKQLLRDVCMHIVAAVPTPAAVRREDVAADVVEKEREIAKGQVAADSKNANKPANILEKIVEGKVNSWFKENILVEQPFVKDDSKTVGQVLKAAGLEPVKFVRLKVGETTSA